MCTHGSSEYDKAKRDGFEEGLVRAAEEAWEAFAAAVQAERERLTVLCEEAS